MCSIFSSLDIDECTDADRESFQAAGSSPLVDCSRPDDVCVNTRGGFLCQTVTCPAGFTRAPTRDAVVNDDDDGELDVRDSGLGGEKETDEDMYEMLRSMFTDYWQVLRTL